MILSRILALKYAPAGHDAQALIPIINTLAQCNDFDLVVYSLDCHPPDHTSFVDNQYLYGATETTPCWGSHAGVDIDNRLRPPAVVAAALRTTLERSAIVAHAESSPFSPLRLQGNCV